MNYTENLTLKKPAYGDNADVADLNYNADILDSYVYNNRQMQAPEYNTQSTYNTGDIVTHNGALYICLADNVTGAWDSTKWSATTLAEQIELAKQSGGESALADLEDVNLTNPSNGQLLAYDGANSKWVNGDATVTKTASGNPIEFTDGADAPLVKCTTQIQGYQEGAGTPSPQNVRPIVAYNQSTISVEDENEVVQQTSTATFSQSIYQGNADFVGGKVGGTWIKIVLDGTQGNYSLIESGRINIDNFTTDNYLHEVDKINYITNLYESIKQTGSNQDFSILASGKDCVCNFSSNTISVALRIKDARFTDIATAKAILAVTPLEIVYELATPTTSSITPTNLPIKSLFGYNHIESSTGEMEIEYITEGYQPLVDLIQSGNGHTYSTQEQVVGKWIDGKTLYEKTFTVTSPTATVVGSYDAYKVVELTGVDVAMFKTGVFIDATNKRNYGLSYDRHYSNTDKMIPEVYVDSQTNTMYVYATCTHSAGFTVSELTITVQYTKSTTTRSLNAPVTSQKAQIEPLTTEEEEVPTEEEKAVNEEENNDETR